MGTQNLLKNSRTLYKCLKPSHNCFKMSEAFRTILKVSETSNGY